MKALVKLRAEPGLWLEEQPAPKIGPDDVLVRVRKTGICGADIHIYNWDEWARRTVPAPMVVGHEYAGEIFAVGANVRDLKVGQRVSGEGHVVGMNSRAARGGRFHMDPRTKGIGVNIPGAFAEFLRIPAFNWRCPTTSTTSSARSSIRSATRCTPRSPSTWSARMC
jgi:threonine 3-dehydrogenase